jgi:putative membrane protein
MKTTTTIFAAVVFAFATYASAEDSKNIEQKKECTAHDKKFIEEAAQGGMAEIQLAELALKNASSDSVKEMAQHIAEDHSKANEELKTIAAQKSVTLPSDVSMKHKQLAEKLSKLTGAEFDKEYTKAMIEDHKKDVMSFEKASKKADDVDLKAFAAKTLPTLKHHLEMAQSNDPKKKKG